MQTIINNTISRWRTESLVNKVCAEVQADDPELTYCVKKIGEWFVIEIFDQLGEPLGYL
jgi:hypothetical protein